MRNCLTPPKVELMDVWHRLVRFLFCPDDPRTRCDDHCVTAQRRDHLAHVAQYRPAPAFIRAVQAASLSGHIIPSVVKSVTVITSMLGGEIRRYHHRKDSPYG